MRRKKNKRKQQTKKIDNSLFLRLNIILLGMMVWLVLFVGFVNPEEAVIDIFEMGCTVVVVVGVLTCGMGCCRYSGLGCCWCCCASKYCWKNASCCCNTLFWSCKEATSFWCCCCKEEISFSWYR